MEMSMDLVTKIEYSRFIRRINRLEREIEQLFIFLEDLFKRLMGSQVYSCGFHFPVEILVQFSRKGRKRGLRLLGQGLVSI